MKEIAQYIFDTLKPGFSESVYHNAFEVMLRKYGYPYETERIVPIFFENHVIGNVRCDIIVNNELIIELKSTQKLKPCDYQQLEKYLHLTGIKNGILINFGSSELEYSELTSKDIYREVEEL